MPIRTHTHIPRAYNTITPRAPAHRVLLFPLFRRSNPRICVALRSAQCVRCSCQTSTQASYTERSQRKPYSFYSALTRISEQNPGRSQVGPQRRTFPRKRAHVRKMRSVSNTHTHKHISLLSRRATRTTQPTHTTYNNVTAARSRAAAAAAALGPWSPVGSRDTHAQPRRERYFEGRVSRTRVNLPILCTATKYRRRSEDACGMYILIPSLRRFLRGA